MAKTSNSKTSTCILIGVAIFLSLVLMSMICKDTEWFAKSQRKGWIPKTSRKFTKF